MQFKWNEKINQVTENTLVVGMDIAKRVHYAYFVDERGRVIEKAFAVHQSKKGFESLKIRQTMKEAKKTDVIVGIEPTGHLLDELGLFLRSLWHSTRHGESNARQTFKVEQVIN